MSDSQGIPEAGGHGVRRLCIAVNLEHYSHRPDSAQVEAQRAMSSLLREAGAARGTGTGSVAHPAPG